MMVNQLNNDQAPWQSTIPNQMPWLNAVSTQAPMQFGQSAYPGANIDCSEVTQSISSLLPPVPPQIGDIATNQITAPISGLVLNNNPFGPQQVAAAVAQQFNDCTPSASQQNDGVQSGHFESSFLTQLPHQHQNSAACFGSQPMHQKRTSMEMEDELTEKEAPPTKQQLSESRLFKRFGSLQLDGETSADVGHDKDDEIDSDDSDDGRLVDCSHDRREFNRYVYLLFKDKKSNNLFDDSTSRAMDRLLRDERDKLNKAVILWNPPMRDFFVSEVPDSDDDDDIKYNDHKDFLKKQSGDNDSIIITEVEDDAEIEDIIPTDDVMQD